MINILLWPFMAVFFVLMVIVGIILFVFWLFMIIDCAKRKFSNDAEKILWIVLMIFTTWMGALVYYFVIKSYNPTGLMGEHSSGKKRKK